MEQALLPRLKLVNNILYRALLLLHPKLSSSLLRKTQHNTSTLLIYLYVMINIEDHLMPDTVDKRGLFGWKEKKPFLTLRFLSSEVVF